jgi:hypothetical protein
MLEHKGIEYKRVDLIAPYIDHCSERAASKLRRSRRSKPTAAASRAHATSRGCWTRSIQSRRCFPLMPCGPWHFCVSSVAGA